MAQRSLLARILKPRPDDHASVRPLWHRTVALARVRDWYAELGIADTVPGRFDAITLCLTLILLRMEASPALAGPSVRLTELFVDDMDGQLRESGVGDLVVGKHIGRLMSTLGGRLGAYRAALADADDMLLSEALVRNLTLAKADAVAALTAAVRALAATLATIPDASLLAGDIPYEIDVPGGNEAATAA